MVSAGLVALGMSGRVMSVGRSAWGYTGGAAVTAPSALHV
jgi:hypothetical protein